MDYKEKIKSETVISVEKPNIGGQQCGLFIPKITVKNDELSIEITIGYYRSREKNKRLALDLLELYIDEIINN